MILTLNFPPGINIPNEANRSLFHFLYKQNGRINGISSLYVDTYDDQLSLIAKLDCRDIKKHRIPSFGLLVHCSDIKNKSILEELCASNYISDINVLKKYYPENCRCIHTLLHDFFSVGQFVNWLEWNSSSGFNCISILVNSSSYKKLADPAILFALGKYELALLIKSDLPHRYLPDAKRLSTCSAFALALYNEFRPSRYHNLQHVSHYLSSIIWPKGALIALIDTDEYIIRDFDTSFIGDNSHGNLLCEWGFAESLDFGSWAEALKLAVKEHVKLPLHSRSKYIYKNLDISALSVHMYWRSDGQIETRLSTHHILHLWNLSPSRKFADYSDYMSFIASQ